MATGTRPARVHCRYCRKHFTIDAYVGCHHWNPDVRKEVQKTAAEDGYDGDWVISNLYCGNCEHITKGAHQAGTTYFSCAACGEMKAVEV